MSRLPILLFIAATACGGKSSSPPVSPLPADQPAAPVAQPEPAPAEPAPPPPLAPVEVTLPAAQVTVKLVSGGKGKKAPLRYTPKVGDKQQAELAMDFTAKQSEPGKEAEAQDQVVPTIVLTGEVETTAVSPDGTAGFTLTVNTTDARDVAGSQLPAEKFRMVLASLQGLTISSTLGAQGASGEITLRIAKPTEMSAGALELIRLTLPTFPMLPKESVGVGAKWRTTASAKLAEKLDVTQVTDYELVSRKGTEWVIKGKTKVSGADQTMVGGEGGEAGKISGIKGSGTSEATIADGTLFPRYKSSIETQFTATEGDKSLQFTLKVGGAVTPTKTAAPAPAPTK